MSYSIEDEHDRMADILDRIRCKMAELRIFTSADMDEADMVAEVVFMMKAYRNMLDAEIAVTDELKARIAGGKQQ